MSERDQILSIFRSTEALLDGHFVLTSGRHSASYFQCAKVLQHPEYLTAFSVMIADEFEEQAPDVVISPAIGGVVLGTEVGTQLGCRTIFAERKDGEKLIPEYQGETPSDYPGNNKEYSVSGYHYDVKEN